jgi:predicted RNase H-like nuclease (RuvC/YqgF family)
LARGVVVSETVLVALVGGGCTVGGVLLTKVFDWLNERVKAPATMLQQQTAFAQALNTQTAAFIEALQENRAHLESTVTELTAKVEAQQGKIEEQARLILDLQSENERCVGEGRQMAQRVDSLEAHLRRNGVPMPSGPPPPALSNCAMGTRPS